MQPVTIRIKPDGTIRYLLTEGADVFLTEKTIVRRASHVEPVNPLLRVAFYGLRSIFGDKGRMTAFTRTWGCKWRVNLAPIGGPVLFGFWLDRQDAIQAEINYLNANFI